MISEDLSSSAARSTRRDFYVATSSPLNGLRVIGGRQRAPQGLRELDDSWYGYGTGVIIDVNKGIGKNLELDPVRLAFEYTSPAGTCGPDDPVLFKSATVAGDRLYATTQTEVVVLSWPALDPVAHISHPIFNDVHHVIPAADDTVLVAVSGHDAVAHLDFDGNLLATWGVGDDRTPPRLDLGRDYRIDCDLKPHAIHPNYLFRLDEDASGFSTDERAEVWVTRFETRDAVSLHDPNRRIDIGRERCHDGVVHDGRIFFTTVDGHVVEVDAATLSVRAEHKLVGRNPDILLGWCRGLTFLDDDLVAVGFSRIRHTRFRQTLSWVRNGLTRSEPTRVAVYNTRTWELVDEQDLEPAGCNAVFSILPVSR